MASAVMAFSGTPAVAAPLPARLVPAAPAALSPVWLVDGTRRDPQLQRSMRSATLQSSHSTRQATAPTSAASQPS
eukprot:CAMPEP_0179120874 /NCGR_PEP_ID=MMETSP0796-20121207/56973_1 /TAXON_ID=73915 /ORGANISM="Pyrodinium bahamense, Strain pbaha01" /LENGTH=74 /DNA_ID=CAMNT_0020819435 /DNA_START=34 /DNA_END=254 /DNA_ORIENTATION=-